MIVLSDPDKRLLAAFKTAFAGVLVLNEPAEGISLTTSVEANGNQLLMALGKGPLNSNRINKPEQKRTWKPIQKQPNHHNLTELDSRDIHQILDAWFSKFSPKTVQPMKCTACNAYITDPLDDSCFLCSAPMNPFGKPITIYEIKKDCSTKENHSANALQKERATIVVVALEGVNMDNTTLSRLNPDLEELLDQEEEHAEVWKPSVGDKLIGTLIKYGKHKGNFGETIYALIRDDEGNSHTVYLNPTMLEKRFAELRPDIGQRIGIKRLESGGKNYKRFRVVVEGLNDSDSFQPDWNSIVNKSEAESRDVEAPPLGDKDGVPF